MESPEHTRDGELGIATASSDKTCILWRWDGRLAYKDVHIRRPKNWEVLLPALLLFVGMAQRVGLAVSSELPWDGRVVRPVRMTFGVTLFDLELSVDPTVQMYAKVCTAIAALVVHLVCAAAGKGAPVVKLTSTVLVVPLVKILVTVFDCSHGLYGHLDSAPEVACFDGWHLVLAVSTGVVGFCYVATLIPLTLVEGDVTSLPKHIWFQPRQWVKRKIAKTQGLDIGWLQPAVRGTVPNAMVEFASLLLLPANAILSSSHPARHALCSLLVCSTSLLVALAFPPKANTKANYLVQGANAISVVAWSAASLSVYLPGSLAAPCLLYGGMSTVLITVCFLLARPVYVGMSLAPSASDEQAVAFLGEV